MAEKNNTNIGFEEQIWKAACVLWGLNRTTNRELMKECDCMKKVWTYFAIGCVVAIIGMFFSDICGDFFNGMDYGSACVLAHYG